MGVDGSFGSDCLGEGGGSSGGGGVGGGDGEVVMP